MQATPTPRHRTLLEKPVKRHLVSQNPKVHHQDKKTPALQNVSERNKKQKPYMV
jgi:hypothetical protein